MSHAEATLEFQLKAANIWAGFEREHRFLEDRRFRFDFAHPVKQLAIEVDGGQYVPGGGRHNRRAGFEKDIEKLNLATLAGWAVLRFTPRQVTSGEALEVIEAYLKGAA